MEVCLKYTEKYTAYEVMLMVLDRYQEATASCFVELDDGTFVHINELREMYKEESPEIYGGTE